MGSFFSQMFPQFHSAVTRGDGQTFEKGYTQGGSSQVALLVKNPPANAGRRKRCRFDSWVGNIPWRKKWQPTPVFLPGEFHGQRSLVGYSPQGHTELEKTEATQHACVLRVGTTKTLLLQLLWLRNTTSQHGVAGHIISAKNVHVLIPRPYE